MTKLAINIDMGATNNGVFVAKIKDDKIISKEAFNVAYDGSNINFQKADRTAARHQRRGFRRKKMLNRLCDEIFAECNFNQSEKEIIYGLTKNRGFTFMNIKFDDEISDETIKELKNITDYEFANCKILTDFEREINEKLSSLDSNEALQFIDEQINLLKNELPKFSDFQKTALQVKKIISSTKNKESLKNLQNIEISDEFVKEFNKYDEYEFKNCKNIDDFKEIFRDKLDLLNDKEFDKFKKSQSEFLAKLLPEETHYHKEIKKIISIFTATRTEIYKNAKHRSKYFDDVKNEIEKLLVLIEKTRFDKDEFYHIICNLSNLQTRVLRRYFNAKFDDKFNDEKLLKKIRQNAMNLHYKSDMEKENFKAINEAFSTYKTAIDFLAYTDPLTTIPPFEDRNNVKPLKCETLTLKSEILTPTIDESLRKILKNENFCHLTIDKNGEILSDYAKFDINQKLTFLHRFLDVSKAFLIDSDLYPRNLDKNKEIFCREIGLDANEFKELKILCESYYNEIQEAKKGLLHGQILSQCKLHTPYKNNCKHEHLSAVFNNAEINAEISPNEAKELENFLFNCTDKISRKTLKGFLSDLSEVKSTLSNKFYFVLKDKDHPNYKDVKFFVDNHEKVIKILNDKFKFLTFKEANQDNLNYNFNALTQLADIMLDDSKGFNKTCTIHTIENRLRMSGETPFASRLAANSARPLINGKVEMLLDRTAWEIVKKISKIHTDINEIVINIEQNKFSFEESARELLKNKEKNKKIKDLSEICPYSGKTISLQNCEFDHIVARHHGGFNEILNSEANLIPCDPSANLLKSNEKITLEKLDDKYKNEIYKKVGVKDIYDFKNFIAVNLPKESEYTNFKNLNTNQQIALRHALFLPASDESFQTALRILRGEKNKTASNGTQKRFINLLAKKLKQKFGENLKLSANLIDSKQVSATRHELSLTNENFKKPDKQNKHSHCIDAMVVFYLSNDGKDFDFGKDIYLDNSDIIIPTAKKFLELEPNKIGSKPLFDKSIYSLEFDSSNLKKDEFEKLRDLDALEIKIKGKKQLVKKSEIFDENAKYFIKSSVIFAKYFEFFIAKNKTEFEKLNFLDKRIKSYVRKELIEIFFDKDLNLKELKDFDKENKIIKDFYKIISNTKNLITTETYVDKNGEKKEKNQVDKELLNSLYKEYIIKNESARNRNKNKVTYSLKIYAPKQANFVINRNHGFEGLINKDIATSNFIDKSDIKQVSFYSRKVLPIKISDILSILNLSSNARQIYKLDKISKKLLPNGILDLKFIISQKLRHDIEVCLSKEILTDFDLGVITGEMKIPAPKKDDKKPVELTLEQKEFERFYDNILNNKFKNILGKPRDKKIKILENSREKLTISYCADQTSKANREFFAKILNYETPCN